MIKEKIYSSQTETIMHNEIVNFIKTLYPDQNPVPLHAPVFLGKEKEYLLNCIDTTFVSYLGKYVNKFEEMTAEYVGAKYAVAVVNGTAGLQISLQLAGVEYGDEVITQPLTFVATANAISHCGAKPIFVDVDLDTLSMSPEKLNDWLLNNAKYDSNKKKTINQITKRPISAIVPVHTFGHPCRIDEIIEIANKFNVPVVEDAAESLGSFYKNKHTGTFCLVGVLSYNGNKTVTTGGGGMIITDDEKFAIKVKHITTTGKIPHKWEYVHDTVAYNYRLTNVNAALGVAQMEYLDKLLANKRETAMLYKEFCMNRAIDFLDEPANSKSNFWLNAILLKNKNERDTFLDFANSNGVMTRPVWRLMNKLEMYKDCQTGNLDNAIYLEERVVNIPSSYRNYSE